MLRFSPLYCNSFLYVVKLNSSRKKEFKCFSKNIVVCLELHLWRAVTSSRASHASSSPSPPLVLSRVRPECNWVPVGRRGCISESGWEGEAGAGQLLFIRINQQHNKMSLVTQQGLKIKVLIEFSIPGWASRALNITVNDRIMKSAPCVITGPRSMKGPEVRRHCGWRQQEVVKNQPISPESTHDKSVYFKMWSFAQITRCYFAVRVLDNGFLLLVIMRMIMHRALHRETAERKALWWEKKKCEQGELKLCAA